MPKYARDARRAYDKGEISKIELVKQVYDKAKVESEKSRNKQLAIRGIRALFALSKTTVHGKFFSIKDIYQEAKICHKQTPTSGLWVWDDSHGCGIVEKAEEKGEYQIKDEFLNPLQQVLEMTNND